MTDEELATLYAQADQLQADAFVRKCHIVAVYRQRHEQHWGESWVEQAYELFEGHPSRRTLQAYANLGEMFDQPDTSLDHIGKLADSASLMRYIGRKSLDDGKVALAAAVDYVAEYGEAPSQAALAHKLGEEQESKAACAHEFAPVLTCTKCGQRSE
jgi:hypothetical protein